MSLTEIANSTGGSWDSGAGTYTFSGVSIGTAAADRKVIVPFTFERNTISAVTIGGVTATVESISQAGVAGAAVAHADVPTGTTADIVFTMSGDPTFEAITTYSLTGAESAAVDSNSIGENGTGGSFSLTTVNGGWVVAASFLRTGGTATWTGASEDYTTTTAGRDHSHASGSTSSTSTTIEAAWSASNNTALAAVSFEPASGGATAITPADAVHSHSADAPTLTADSTVTPADAAHAHSADAPTLAAASSLTPAGALHGHTADAPTLAANSAITPAATLHAHTADQASISSSSLTVDSASHAHSAAVPTLAASSALVPADALHGHSAASATLSTSYAITPADAAHAHGADAATLAFTPLLAPASALHAHSADAANLSGTGLDPEAIDGATVDVLARDFERAVAARSFIPAVVADTHVVRVLNP